MASHRTAQAIKLSTVMALAPITSEIRPSLATDRAPTELAARRSTATARRPIKLAVRHFLAMDVVAIGSEIRFFATKLSSDLPFVDEAKRRARS